MKYWPLLAYFLAFPLVSSAQIKFNEITHDFGSIKEGEVVTHKFVFTNTGKTPVNLQSVKASCGCTTPYYSRSSVAPGDTGSVSAVYNSQGRPGKFTKSVTVIYDTAQSPIILMISGDVISKEVSPSQPAPPTPSVQPAKPVPGSHQHPDGSKHTHPHFSLSSPIKAEDNTLALVNANGSTLNWVTASSLPVLQPQPLPLPAEQSSGIYFGDTIGGLAFDRTYIDLGTVTSDESKEVVIKVKNVSNQTINLLKSDNGRPWIQLVPQVQSLTPGMESNITLRFVGPEAKKQGLGSSIEERVVLTTSEAAPLNQKYFNVTGLFKRTLTPEELANAPKIVFDAETFDAGEILAGESLKHAFVFHNRGKSDLVIESAKASCGCTASAPKEKVIKPGESSLIEATFNSQGREGQQHKTITVVSNDPNTPKVTLHVKCNVKPDPFSIGQDGLPLNSGGKNQPFGKSGF